MGKSKKPGPPTRWPSLDEVSGLVGPSFKERAYRRVREKVAEHLEECKRELKQVLTDLEGVRTKLGKNNLTSVDRNHLQSELEGLEFNARQMEQMLSMLARPTLALVADYHQRLEKLKALRASEEARQGRRGPTRRQLESPPVDLPRSTRDRWARITKTLGPPPTVRYIVGYLEDMKKLGALPAGLRTLHEEPDVYNPILAELKNDRQCAGRFGRVMGSAEKAQNELASFGVRVSALWLGAAMMGSEAPPISTLWRQLWHSPTIKSTQVGANGRRGRHPPTP